MRSIVFHCLNVIQIIAFTGGYTLEDFDLPGVFSNAICTSPDFQGTLAPLCSCKQQWNFTDIRSLCRLHKELGECIETEMMKNSNTLEGTANGYFHFVFGKGRFRQNLDHLCRKQTDAAGIASCSTPSIVRQCNVNFEIELHKLTEETAYSKTEVLSNCFWDSLKPNCSASTTYFWWKLAESHLGRHCTKYGKARAETCRNIEKAFHPYVRSSVKECLNAVHTVKECLILERLESIHHEDVLQNIEFEIENYVILSTLKCEMLEKYKQNKQCEEPFGEGFSICYVSFKKKHAELIESIRQGQNVTPSEICLAYTNVVNCINDVLKTCTVNSEFYRAMICAWMPAKCHCPKSAQHEHCQLKSATTRHVFISSSAQQVFILGTLILLLFKIV